MTEPSSNDDGPEIWFDDGAEDHGWAVGELDRELEHGFSTVWKDIREPMKARATISVAAHEEWSQAKLEFEFLRVKMEKIIGTRKPSFETIFDLIFGQQSPIYKLFVDEGIFDSYDSYRQFIATYFLSSSYQVSTKQLFDKFSRIDRKGAMEKEEYLAKWKIVGNHSLPPIEERNKNLTPIGMVPFRMKLEDTLNRYKRELFIKDIPGVVQATLDDDKPHTTANKYNAGWSKSNASHKG